MDEKYFVPLTELLAKEYNCDPEDLMREKNVLTESALIDGRRQYEGKYFFHMVTLGSNAVLTADKCLHPYLKEFIKDISGHLLFELPNILPLLKELERFGYTLTQSYHMFLPHTDALPKRDYPVKWFCGREEIEQFYGDPRFPNALCESYTPQRPDTIAVCAYDGDKIMGMAGCSEDAPHWQQIGIDVLPEYRSMGVGSYLVALLKNRILENGDIPFYGTGLSNYHSWNIALNCGFRPAWVEIGARKQNHSG